MSEESNKDIGMEEIQPGQDANKAAETAQGEQQNAAKDGGKGASKNPMMRIENLYITFNRGTPIENPALRGLSLDIDDGEFVTVIGSNGAGKSTLLNAISGEIRTDFGRILVNDVDVTKKPPHKRSKMIARVLQDPMAGTCESLSIEENLSLAFSRGQRRTLRMSLNKEVRDIFKQKLSILQLGLENRLTDRMGLLSGGQRQAVSLLMASLRPSKILLLDEHTAALDPKTASFVLDLTDQIVKESKMTVLMVTHSMKDALEHGTRTVMLHQGKVILDVKGEERKNMTVSDLLKMFEKTRGAEIYDDSLLLG